MKRWLLRSVLAVCLAGVLGLYFLLETALGLSVILDVVGTKIPGTLTLQQATGKALGPFTLTGVQYQNNDMTLQIDTLQVDWQPGQLLWKTLDLRSLHADGIRLTRTNHKGQSSHTAIQLPLTIQLHDAQLTHLTIRTEATLPPTQIEQLSLRGRSIGQTINVEKLQLKLPQLQLQTAGQLALTATYPVQLAVQWEYTASKGPHLAGSGTIHGDMAKLHVVQEVRQDIDATLQGDITGILAGLHWQADLQLRKTNTARWGKAYASLVIRGAAHGAGDLHNIQVAAELQTTGKKLGTLFSTVRTQTQNAFNDYSVNLEGKWQDGATLKANLALAGTGTTKGLQIDRLYVKTVEGTLRANANVQWLPQLSATANVALDNIDTALFLPSWPGHIGAQASVQTKLSKGKPVVTLELQALSGDLRGYGLRGKANAHWTQAQLEIDQLDVHLGDTRLIVQGSYKNAWNVHVQLSSGDINALLPKAHGKMEFSGDVQGARSAPQLLGKLEGSALSYNDNSIGHISGQLNVQPLETAPLQLNLQANDIVMADNHWASASIHADGTNAVHSLEIRFDGADAYLHGRIRGSYREQAWQGVLAQLDFQQEPFGRWQLRQPINFLLSAQQQQMDELCLQQAASQVCLALDWQAQQASASLRGKAMPLRIVDYWLPEDILLTGQADLTVQITRGATQNYSGVLDVSTVAKAMSLNFVKQNVQINFGENRLHAVLDNDALKVKLAMPLQDNAGVTAEVDLPHWTWTAPLARSQELQGKLQLAQLPVAMLAQFIPQLGPVQGNLNAHADIAGTLGELQLTSNAAWENGRIDLPILNISLQDIQAKLNSAENNYVKFLVTARSGDGNVRLEGATQLLPTEGWPTQVHLSGNELVISNTPEAFIKINPNLDVNLKRNGIAITGDVTIPRARLRPTSLTDGTVPISSDVIISKNDQAESKEERWKISTRIRVNLGEVIDFDGFGVSGKLTGNLLLLDEPGKLPFGQGEIGITDGIYRMRGQNLNITRGRLIYANSLLDDPGIDVEATRVINDVTAGVRVRGTLKKPELSVFSDPAMGESDALAYLLLGRPLNQANTTEGQSVRDATTAMGVLGGDLLAHDIGGRLGLDELRVEVTQAAAQTSTQTSLVAGKYLSPKLYIRYFTGIVDSSNIVQLRYQLSKKVQIQTESGYRGTQSITGGDIFFTIEY